MGHAMSMLVLHEDDRCPTGKMPLAQPLAIRLNPNEYGDE